MSRNSHPRIAEFFLIVFLILAMWGPASGASPESSELVRLKAELSSMRERMERMQVEMEVMAARVTALTAAKEHQEQRMRREKAPRRVEAPPSPRNPGREKIRFYGKIKMDAIWDSNDLGSNELIKYIPARADGRSQASFTARETRFGMEIAGPRWEDWRTTGKLETDFYGSAASAGSGSLRLRLAYTDISNGRTGIRIGQDWIPLSGLNPATTNFAILGYNGNLWGRTPQVTIRRSLGGDWSGLVTAFRCREQEDLQGDLDCDLELPWMGAKLGFEPRMPHSEKRAYLGLSGAVRHGEVNGQDVTPALAAFEFRLPLGRAELSGELYYGRGLGGEFFHAGGAYNLLGEPIGVSGGYAQLGLRATERLRLHFGYGMDDPEDGDLLGDQFYRRSTSLFSNANWRVAPDLSVILEGTRVETTWQAGSRDGIRLQSSMLYLW